jgi:hypothetical protein
MGNAKPTFAHSMADMLRRRRPRPTSQWHLDEMTVMIAGREFWLWRVVDNEGEVLDLLVQRRDSGTIGGGNGGRGSYGGGAGVSNGGMNTTLRGLLENLEQPAEVCPAFGATLSPVEERRIYTESYRQVRSINTIGRIRRP